MRVELGEYIRRIMIVFLFIVFNIFIIDYEVFISGEWFLWQVKVFQIEVEMYKVVVFDVVVLMLDIVCYEVFLYIWLVEYKFLVLCGFFGFGKIMIFFSVFWVLFDMEVVGFNFFSVIILELFLKIFDYYCEYRCIFNGVVLVFV